MIRSFFKVVAVVTSALLPVAGMAADCVEDAGDTVILSYRGQPIQVGVIESYTALIAPRDLTNSRGVRLNDVAAVLQQDRANVHKTGTLDRDGDFSDQYDGYFTSLKQRSQFGSARYYTACYMTPSDNAELKSAIVNARVRGLLWVVAFRHPKGGLGIYLSEVN